MLYNYRLCKHVFIRCDKPQVLVGIVRYKYCKLYFGESSILCHHQLLKYLERGHESLTSGGSGGIFSQRKAAETQGEGGEGMTMRSGWKYKDDPRAAEVMAEEGEMRESGGGGLGVVPEGGHGDGAMAAMFRLMQTQQEHHQRDRQEQQRMMERQMGLLQRMLERGEEREDGSQQRPGERAGEAAEQIKLTTFERMMRLGAWTKTCGRSDWRLS